MSQLVVIPLTDIRDGGPARLALDGVARARALHFSPHMHGGGEEFLVLDGVFQDEHGDFPAGTYVRNPPQSSHTPGSKPGCTMFVKLWQFDLADRTHVRLDTNKLALLEVKERDGVSLMPLFKDAHEDVRLEQWAAGTRSSLIPRAGLRCSCSRVAFARKGRRTRRSHGCGCPWGRISPRASAARAAACGSRRATSVTSKQCAPRARGSRLYLAGDRGPTTSPATGWAIASAARRVA